MSDCELHPTTERTGHETVDTNDTCIFRSSSGCYLTNKFLNMVPLARLIVEGSNLDYA